METPASDLRFVDADRVDTPAGRLNDTVVINPSNATLGKLAGIVVDPVGRQVRGYVIESRKWLSSRRYLVPAVPARFDRHRHALEMDLDETQLDEVGPHTFQRFSDDDLIAALFHKQSDDV
jgi:PRC-barrel domain protein